MNGIRIKNLRHFVEVLRDSKEKFTRISFDDKACETMVFDHQEAFEGDRRDSLRQWNPRSGVRRLDCGVVQEKMNNPSLDQIMVQVNVDRA